MNIFDNKKTVVGLFSSTGDADKVLNELQDRGFGAKDSDSKLEVIDQFRLTGETDADTASERVVAAPSSPAGPVTTGGPYGTEQAEESVEQQNVRETLTDMGVNNEDASFYARQVVRGNTLIVVQADEDKAKEALELIKQVQARASMS